MFCPNCGSQNADDVVFCASCGQKMVADPVPATAPVQPQATPVMQANVNQAPVNQAPVNQAPVNAAANAKAAVTDLAKKFEFKPLYGVIAGAAVLVIILIIIIANAAGGSSAGKSVVADIYSIHADKDETQFVYNDKILEDKVNSNVSIYAYSSDDSVALASGEGELYVVTSKGVEHVDDDVANYSISADGSTVAYINEDGDLYKYIVKSKKSEKLADDVFGKPVLSPSGKAVAYMVKDDDEYFMYVNNGKEVKIGEDYYPIALSDNCKYIYYYNYDKGALFVTDTKDNKVKIASECYGNYLFNKDCSQVLFGTYDGVFLSVKGGDKTKINGNAYYATMLYNYTDAAYYSTSGNNVGSVYIYEFKSFANQYIVADSSVYLLNGKFENTKVVNNFYSLSVAEDLSALYYKTSDYSLKYVKLGSKKAEATKVAKNVGAYAITPDGKGVYYINDDDELCYVKGIKDSEKIADDVDSLIMTHDGIALFMTDYKNGSGTLYSSKNGGKKTSVNDDCYSYEAGSNTTYISTNYDKDDYVYDLSATKKGTSFKLLIEEIY